MAGAELNGRYDGLVPLVPVPLPTGAIEAILDTGFDGALMVPSQDFDGLDDRVEFLVEVMTATGVKGVCVARRIRMTWLGVDRDVDVVKSEAGFALVGMELLRDAETVLAPAAGLLRVRSNG